MLIVKVFVNHKEIDEIKIQNISPIGDDSKFQQYKIIEPEINGVVISHKYADGYRPLLEKALATIRKIGITCPES